jgi:hypothetical protein
MLTKLLAAGTMLAAATMLVPLPLASAAATATLTGRIEVVASDTFAGGGSVAVLLHAGSRTYTLRDVAPALVRTGETVTVTAPEPVKGAAIRPDRVARHSAAPAVSTTGTQSVYVIRADWSGDDGTTLADVQAGFDAASQWFDETSYGALPGLAVTSLDHWDTIAAPTGCDYTTIYNEAVAAEQTATDGAFQPSSYQHVVIYMPLDGECSWAGLGDIDGPDVWLNGQGSYYSTLDTWATTHELGHNLGLYHSHAATCFDSADNPVTASNDCPDPVEYGDPSDVMGDSDVQSVDGVFVAGQYNAAQKARLGWLGSGLVDAAPCTTVDLTPYEVNSGGTLAAKVVDGADPQTGIATTYWLEWRQPGADSVDANLSTGLTDGVLLHRTASDDPDPGPWLLDGTPNVNDDFSAAAVPDGTSVSTPEGETFAVGTPTAGTLPVTISTSVPSTPAAPQVVAGVGQVTVSWTVPQCTGTSSVVGYDLQSSTDSGQTWTSVPGADPSAATTQTVTGLSAGTSYDFRVAAINASGSGAYSATSDDVTPQASPSSLSISGATKVTAGQRVTLGTTLTDSAGSPVAHAGVRLEKRRSASARWSMVTSAVTDSVGAATDTTVPLKHNTFFRWVFAGTPNDAPSSSATADVIVAQAVSARLDPARVTLSRRHGRLVAVRVTIYGSVSPNEIGETVHLQRREAGAWTTLKDSAVIERQTLPNGVRADGFVMTLRVAKRGHSSLRVHRAATADNGAGVSRKLRLTVT